VTVPPKDPTGPPEDESESEPESPKSEDDQAGQDASDNAESTVQDILPWPTAFRLMPDVDLSRLLDLADFSKLIVRNLPDWSRLMPNLSGLVPPSAMLPVTQFEELVYPALHLSKSIPKVDYASFFPKIELPDLFAVLPRTLPEFSPDFLRFLERLRKSLPPNWPKDIDFDQVTTVIQDDGLPLVWVPRAEIVTELLASVDRAAKIEVLLSHVDELVEDCRAVLGDVSHDMLSGQQPLALKALDAFAAGHHEAAQALAVTVTETAVARALGNKYAAVKQKVLFDPELVHYTELRLQAALAPIGPFYTTWYASSGTPMPAALSRHVTVHQADEEHYTRGNATVAVLLVTSVLRALQELQEIAEASEDDP
jgi:hypothetical protein